MVPDGWSIKKLGELGRSMGGLTYSPEDVIPAGGILVLRSSNILNAEIVYGNDVFVRGSVPDSVRVQPGDILVCARNGSRSLIGKSALIDADAAGHAFGAFMAVYRSQHHAYIFQLFQTSLFKRQVDRHLGVTINQVTAKSLASFRFSIPPANERTKIVEILTSWDREIVATRRLLKLKRRLKRGLMQQLLTGRRRFPEFAGRPWREVRLGDVLHEVNRTFKLAPDTPYRLVSIRRRSGGFFDREVKLGNQIGYPTLEQIHEGDFVIARRQVLHGAMATVPEAFDGAYVSNAYAILEARNPNEFHVPFFNFVSQQPRLYYLAFRCSYGVAIEKMFFRLDWFLKERLHIPPTLAEQQKITSVLTAADRELALLEQQLAVLREQKKGLMQKLLTGRVRVKVPKEKS